MPFGCSYILFSYYCYLNFITVIPSAVIRTPDKVFAKVGETINLLCETTGYPEPKVFWMKDDREVYPSAELSVNPKSLVLPQISISDEGIYMCVAENLVGSSRDKASIYVHGI